MSCNVVKCQKMSQMSQTLWVDPPWQRWRPAPACSQHCSRNCQSWTLQGQYYYITGQGLPITLDTFYYMGTFPRYVCRSCNTFNTPWAYILYLHYVPSFMVTILCIPNQVLPDISPLTPPLPFPKYYILDEWQNIWRLLPLDLTIFDRKGKLGHRKAFITKYSLLQEFI